MWAIVLCSIAYAYRGGRLGQRSGFIGRLAWFAAVGVSVWGLSGNALYGLLSACGAFAGNMISHGHYFAMGRVSEPVNTKDWLGDIPDWLAMFIIGCLRGIIWPPAFLLFGVAHAAAYELGWRLDRKEGIWISEYIYGALVGLLLWLFV